MKNKYLTRELVEKLGWDKVEYISADMLEGYTNIGDCAFCDCRGLISITIPDSVKSIGYCAFYECRGLTSVTIPDSVTSIGESTFSGCTKLNSVTVGNSVTSIGFGVFRGCTSLTSVTIPDSVRSIGTSAFCGCESLTSMTIGDSVTSIERYAFESCPGLSSVIIGDVEYKKHEIIDGKCKAYKAFNSDMTCRDFQYEESKTYEIDNEPVLCRHGFHACLNLADVFNYYCGKLGEDIHIHEVEVEGVSSNSNYWRDSKIVGNKITIGKRIA